MAQNPKLKYYQIDWWGDTSWYGYLAYYEFLYNEVFPKYKNQIFEDYLSKCHNISSIVTFENIAFISRPPVFINFNEKNHLHCVHDAAVAFKDGWKLYYIDGVYFDETIFKKFFMDKNWTSKDFVEIDNAEQKAIIIKEIGFEKLIDLLPNKIVVDNVTKPFNNNKHQLVNYQLISFQLNNNEHKMVKVEWYEAGKKRRTVLGVPNTITDVIEAVAWTCYKTKEEWEQQLIKEA